MDEAGAVHRLDDRRHVVAVPGEAGDELAQPDHLGRGRGHLDRPALLVEDVHVKPLARQVQSGVQHAWASWCVVPREPNVLTTEALLHDIQSTAGVATCRAARPLAPQSTTVWLCSRMNCWT